ncbi:MAG: DUF3576 domain-containing protein [Alphaproteobacteria bacterium]|nr:DUF3576 domain-containing protein [Alphaproteobacteria bacterium]
MSAFKSKIYSVALILAVSTGVLTGCNGIKTEAKYPSGLDRNMTGNNIYGKKESVIGEGGFLGKRKKSDGESAIGVNSFLWRATLDTVSFMPLASADPFGGVILTDWYTDPQKPNERVKINAFIMGRELKANGIRVRTFRQVRKGGEWRDANVSEDTSSKLEDAILIRARELRIANLADER